MYAPKLAGVTPENPDRLRFFLDSGDDNLEDITGHGKRRDRKRNIGTDVIGQVRTNCLWIGLGHRSTPNTLISTLESWNPTIWLQVNLSHVER